MVLHDEYGFDNADLLDVTVGLTFTDASGVNWRRDPDGRLHQVEPAQP